MTQVVINDVGPRDGLQNDPATVTPAQRIQLIRALIDAGIPAIEVASFVSPKAVPKMAGAAEVVSAFNDSAADLSVLIPNEKGYELAKAAGARSVAVVLSATDTMNRKNINMSLEQTRAVCRSILEQAARDGLVPRAYVSVAVECPYEGLVDDAVIETLAGEMFSAGAAEVTIADTIGAANPAQIKRLFSRLAGSFDIERIAGHFHDTRAMALANAWQAIECGVRRLDASVAGLGGCPFAPGAAGNLATEDLALMLNQAGIETGVDLEALLAAVDLARALVGRPVGGRSLAWQEQGRAA